MIFCWLAQKRKFYSLLQITFADSLNPDQDQLSVGPDLDANCWHCDSNLKDFFALFKIECLFLEAFKGQVKQMIQTFSPNVGLQKLSNYLS